MYAKSFIALDGNRRLTGSTTVQLSPYDHYSCHLCGSALIFHPEWGSNRPWFEHTWEDLTETGRGRPMAHPNWTLQREASPAATMFFAT